MKTPSFWHTQHPLFNLLLPAAFLYQHASMLYRMAARPVTLPIPVICVGNLTAGGAGKTPVALAIGAMLKAKNVNAFFLSKGYGGTQIAPLRVNPRVHTAKQVGDEPLLLAGVLPTVVAKDRKEGAMFALGLGADVIVMDDGFQNPFVTKNLSLLVIDGVYGFGNGHLIPAGPLREPPESGFARADAIIVINPSDTTPPLPEGKPVLRARTKPLDSAHALAGKKLVAFCGLATPQKFFSTLTSLGAQLVKTVAFGDHHPYRASEIKKLADDARHAQALLVTTAKDAVRLSPELRPLVTIVDITLEFDDKAQLEALLAGALAPA